MPVPTPRPAPDRAADATPPTTGTPPVSTPRTQGAPAAPTTSRFPGFYRRSIEQRRQHLASSGFCPDDLGSLPVEVANRMSENVIGCHCLPLGLGLNFVVNGRERVVPMAVEEPSVVAAASRAALMARAGGGFVGQADPPVMTAQVHLDRVPDVLGAPARVAARRAEILALGNRAIPSMIARGGGCRDLEVRVLESDSTGTAMVVVHIYVEVGDAMGANLADTVAEAVAPALAELTGGEVALRILSNLPLRRMVRVSAAVPVGELGGPDAAAGVARASRCAEIDPLRAVTHNKGIMNGIDAACVALGQDWRAVEAGAHAYAALSGRYRPLAIWRTDGATLTGQLELPLAAATVGGATRVHPGVRAAFDLLGLDDARELAVVLAAVGLASNLAALSALAGEGIQRGHMELHRRRLEGASGDQS